MKNNICVFCSSSDALSYEYFQVAKELGEQIGTDGDNLIHGGGKIGLMGALANSVQKFGGKVVGVIPEKLNEEGIASETDDELIITKDMAERKSIMIERSDAFIALPGGFGTLEEVIEVITLKQLKYHQKPIAFLNVNNFYSNLFKQFELFYEENFAIPEYRDLFLISDDIEEVITYIKEYQHTDIKDKWFHVIK